MPIGVLPVASSGGGGSSSGVGLYSSRPPAGNTGATYYPTDQGLFAVDDGAEWRPVLAGYLCRPVYLPDLPIWTNQGGASAQQWGDSVVLSAPAVQLQYRCRTKSLPGVSFAISSARAIASWTNNAVIPNGGPIMRRSSDGRAFNIFIGQNSFGNQGPMCGAVSWADPTNRLNVTFNVGNGFAQVLFGKIAVDGTDAVAYFSQTPNGPWLETVRYAGFWASGAPDEAGINVGCENDGIGQVIYEHFECG